MNTIKKPKAQQYHKSKTQIVSAKQYISLINNKNIIVQESKVIVPKIGSNSFGKIKVIISKNG